MGRRASSIYTQLVALVFSVIHDLRLRAIHPREAAIATVFETFHLARMCSYARRYVIRAATSYMSL